MSSFTATRQVGVPAAVAYGVAADVGAYKQFIPLLQRSQIRGVKRIENGCEIFDAELAVAYEKLGVRESFLSHVSCDPQKQTVTATSNDGPFRSMRTQWSFTQAGRATDVSIHIEYSLRNPLIQFAIGGAMSMAVDKIISVFEARAKSVHASKIQPQA